MSTTPLIVPNTDGAAPERLSETELAHHRRVLAEVGQLAAIDQQLAALQARRAAIVGIRDTWMAFQQDARGLDDGDSIDGDGYVHRTASGGLTVTEGDDG